MNGTPKSVREILDRADELADRFEAFDPERAVEIPVDEYVREHAARQAAAHED